MAITNMALGPCPLASSLLHITYCWVWLHWSDGPETAQLPSDTLTGQRRVLWHEPVARVVARRVVRREGFGLIIGTLYMLPLPLLLPVYPIPKRPGGFSKTYGFPPVTYTVLALQCNCVTLHVDKSSMWTNGFLNRSCSSDASIDSRRFVDEPCRYSMCIGRPPNIVDGLRSWQKHSRQKNAISIPSQFGAGKKAQQMATGPSLLRRQDCAKRRSSGSAR
ncbi:hypothetical protein F4678DRAFT_103537 [Xylaria arbuscula]|nr:hypothetical protein F4678DRAFT_103537 [Xylaria arbuscula]